MPIITITACGQKSKEFKNSVFDAVQAGLLVAKVPLENKLHRFIELSPENFRFSAQFSGTKMPRGDDFILIEVLWSTGRHAAIKKEVLKTMINELIKAKFNPEDVFVFFTDTAWENWACAGGRLDYV